MAIRQLELPLFNKTFYSYSLPLQGNQYTLQFLYLERIDTWLLSLIDSNGVYLVRNQRMTPNTLLFRDYKVSPELTGAFYFTPLSNEDPERLRNSVESPKGNYILLYIFDDGE